MNKDKQTLRQVLLDNPDYISEFDSYQRLGEEFEITRERARQVVEDLVNKGRLDSKPNWKSGRRKLYKTEEERKLAKSKSSKKYYENKKKKLDA